MSTPPSPRTASESTPPPSTPPRVTSTPRRPFSTPAKSRRSYTVTDIPSLPGPSAPSTPASDAVNILFAHTASRIVSFSISPRVLSGPPLPWRHVEERTIASGPLRIYKTTPAEVSFLQSGSALKPLLSKTQVWNVDGRHTFCLQLWPGNYWRIEILGEDLERAVRAAQFGECLAGLVAYESTKCPFVRAEDCAPLVESADAMMPARVWRRPSLRTVERVGEEVKAEKTELERAMEGRHLRRASTMAAIPSGREMLGGAMPTPPATPTPRGRQRRRASQPVCTPIKESTALFLSFVPLEEGSPGSSPGSSPECSPIRTAFSPMRSSFSPTRSGAFSPTQSTCSTVSELAGPRTPTSSACDDFSMSLSPHGLLGLHTGHLHTGPQHPTTTPPYPLSPSQYLHLDHPAAILLRQSEEAPRRERRKTFHAAERPVLREEVREGSAIKGLGLMVVKPGVVVLSTVVKVAGMLAGRAVSGARHGVEVAMEEGWDEEWDGEVVE